jgi:sugar phosphate isomerase/epimerase
MKTGRGTRDVGRGIARREFVGTLAAGVGAVVLPSPLLACPPPAAATRLARIGIQLYTVREVFKNDFNGTLDRIGAIGYNEVEFAGYFDHTPEQVRAALAHAGLTAPATHVGPDNLGKSWDALVNTAKAVGHEYVIVAWVPEEMRKTLDDWKRIAEQMNQAGTACRAAGLQFAYHNHNFEFAPIDGRVPYDLLLESTDPGLVKLEMDLFWATFAGADPLAYFARFPGRFPLVHVKDMMPKPTPDATPDKVMVDVGKGSIDWKRIFAKSSVGGIQHYFVEHDQPADPLASAKASYDYLHGLDF